jgi:iron complex transport system permease protein
MRALTLAILAATLTLVVTPFVGSGGVNLNGVISGDPLERRILIDFRLSRTVLAMLAGGSLSLAGCLFQAMLRNSLATPYTLGVSGGAALGAVLMIILGLPLVWLGAFAGALAVLTIVAGFAARQARLSIHGLVLAGIAVNSVCSALIMLLHSFAGFSQSFSITTWLIGGVDAVVYSRLAWYAAAAIPIWAAIVWQAPSWNLLAVSDQWAAARGADVGRLLRAGYLGGSLLAAATVSLTGPIGFVGLLVPHIVRGIAGADHRWLMPCSLLFGASFVAICDAIARTVMAPAELPVGVITALLGGPGLISLLRSQHAEVR